MLPEVYSEEERKAVEAHIEACFGAFETVLHEVVSPDIHVDVCVIPPAKDRNYYTLVTMGMGAHRMNVPAELAEYRLERAELAIALPADWKVDQEAFRDEQWYWPVRLLKTLARLPGECHTWLGWGAYGRQSGAVCAEYGVVCIYAHRAAACEGGRRGVRPARRREVNFISCFPVSGGNGV